MLIYHISTLAFFDKELYTALYYMGRWKNISDIAKRLLRSHEVVMQM